MVDYINTENPLLCTHPHAHVHAANTCRVTARPRGLVGFLLPLGWLATYGSSPPARGRLQDTALQGEWERRTDTITHARTHTSVARWLTVLWRCMRDEALNDPTDVCARGFGLVCVRTCVRA